MDHRQNADVVLSSNAVFTGVGDQPEPASIAISKNKIIAIGSEDEIKPYIGENTKVHLERGASVSFEPAVRVCFPYEMSICDGPVQSGSARKKGNV